MPKVELILESNSGNYAKPMRMAVNRMIGCPITGGCETFLPKSSFIRTCLAMQIKAQGKGVNCEQRFAAYTLGECIHCPIGKKVQKGLAFVPPPRIVFKEFPELVQAHAEQPVRRRKVPSKSEQRPKVDKRLKVNEEDVLRIRELRNSGMMPAEIHSHYPYLNKNTVISIINRRTWNHI